ncbi:MAG: agmatinase family protein [Cyclobacteriaceae bacterium]|nr:agmatinase family protein [Cyclobacteriaceae bacterium]
MSTFDHNGPGLHGKLFGLPVEPETAGLVVLPVPWEVTVTFREGTAGAPAAVLKASNQVDLFHHYIPEAWNIPVTMQAISHDLGAESKSLRSLAHTHIQSLESGLEPGAGKVITTRINEACENLNIFVKSQAQNLLRAGKLVAVLGGDHSTPLGLLRALAEKYERFGVLHLDAHADLRKAYEGFTYSHASIMFNALKLPAIARIVQVGIRDYCEEENLMMQRAAGRVKTFFDPDLKTQLAEGATWKQICDKIIHEVPQQVYISFDIDVLNPSLCPNTGTPVPGGLEFDQAVYLIRQVVKSGRKIIGFDLCEVSPHEWDANVGARVLWELSQYTIASHRE